MTAKQKWWRLFCRHEPALKEIARRFEVCDPDLWDELVLKHDLNRLGHILQETWVAAPDAPWIHHIPSWHVLCDLCSEFVFGDASK